MAAFLNKIISSH